VAILQTILLTLAFTQAPYGNPNVAQAQALRQNAGVVQPVPRDRSWAYTQALRQNGGVVQPARQVYPVAAYQGPRDRSWSWAYYQNCGGFCYGPRPAMIWYRPQVYSYGYWPGARQQYSRGFGFGVRYRSPYTYRYYGRPSYYGSPYYGRRYYYPRTRTLRRR